MANDSGRNALVLYGSETGNAHDLADELARTVRRLHFSSEVLPLDSIHPIALTQFSIVLISISTTGQGDLPANAKAFFKHLLRKKLPPTYLLHANIAVFGLGDTSYPQYNWAALKLHKRLIQLGATDLVDPGEGDEQHPEGSDTAFIPWLQNLKAVLVERFPLPEGRVPIPDDELLQPPWLLAKAVVDSTSKEESYMREASTPPGADAKALAPENAPQAANFAATLEVNKRVTSADHFQDVRHLTFSTSEHLSYVPGDVLIIYPRNMDDDVDQLLKLMEWEEFADDEIHFAPNMEYENPLRPSKPSIFEPGKVGDSLSLRRLLTWHLDFNAIPRRSFFALIAHFTKDEFQKERLLEFANPDLVDELFDYTTRPRRSILEVLQEFDTLSIPWQWAATLLPSLRGRQFSIASGGALKCANGNAARGNGEALSGGTKFELLVAIVKYRTVIKKIRRGVCTRYLEALEPGTRLCVTLQRGGLGLTRTDLNRPVIMVGPGTGLAPVRALIWERCAWARQSITEESTGITGTQSQNWVSRVGTSVLFFGCRGEHTDFFFRDEWETLKAQGVPLTVITAFSRDQRQKVYVQDQIKENHELLYRLLDKEDGIIFVCGSSGKMPQAVRAAFLDVFQRAGGIGPADAQKRLKALEKMGRYKQETW